MKVEDILKTIKGRKKEEKIDILLIHCDLFYDIEFSSISMGLVYIATYLSGAGYKADILTGPQLYNMSREKTRRAIQRKNPSIVGFYVISDNYEQIRDMADDIREWLPEAKIIAGGPLAAALREKLLEHPSFDMVCTGEGEIALSIICDALLRGKGGISDAPGIIFRENGRIIHGKPAEPISDLDSLPFPDPKYFRGAQVFQVVSGRGCPYHCVFCFQAGHGLKFRFRSAENVTREIISLLDAFPMVGFDFIDDAFIMNPKRCLDISSRLVEYRRESRRDFIFFCQGRVNVLDKHPEIIPALVRAGLVKMQLGIESGDPEILRLYRKGITIEQVYNTVRNIRDTASATAVGGFILGGPFETEETFSRTLELATDLIREAPGVFEASAGFMGAYPGTEIADDPAKFGLKVEEEDFIKGLSLSDVQLTTEVLDKNRLRDLKGRFQEAAIRAMADNLHRIPRDLIQKHFLWAERYKIYSLWYLYFLNKMGAVRNYFKFLKSPKFRSFDEIPLKELGRWRPMRVQEERDYSPDGSLKLPYSVCKGIIFDPGEILAYELCSGKLTVRDAVSRFCHERNIKGNESEVYANIFIPMFRRLDKSYHIVFFE